MASNKNKTLASSGLVVGLLAGAAAAFFLAPRRGVDTQKKMALKVNELAQKTIAKAQNGLLKFEDTLEKTNMPVNEVDYKQVKDYDL